MREVPVYQLDAFTDRAFSGNPAAVCPFDAYPEDTLMQAIAAENNLAETAFIVPVGDRQGHYHLRWFTPTTEVALCGHATLASGYVVMTHLAPGIETVTFETRPGTMTVSRQGDGKLCLDFPNLKPQPTKAPEGLSGAMGAEPLEVLDANTGDDDLLLVYAHADTVQNLKPDPQKMAALHPYGFIVTAPGTGPVDFVSRCFFPNKGIPEDPVTGSAHCASGPYWAKKLEKKQLFARQVSSRAGDLWLTVSDDRVLISGHVVEVMRGTLFLPD